MGRPMWKAKSKGEVMRLLNTGGYILISDLGVALGPDRLRAKYGLAQALAYPAVAELLKDAQKIQELVGRVIQRIEDEEHAGEEFRGDPEERPDERSEGGPPDPEEDPSPYLGSSPGPWGRIPD